VLFYNTCIFSLTIKLSQMTVKGCVSWTKSQLLSHAFYFCRLCLEALPILKSMWMSIKSLQWEQLAWSSRNWDLLRATLLSASPMGPIWNFKRVLNASTRACVPCEPHI